MGTEEASRWSELLEVVREKVKPGRDKLKNNADGRRRKRYWWQFGRWTPALYAAIAGRRRCLVNSQVSKYLVFAFQPTDRIFAHTLYAYPFEDNAHFAVLQSRIHEAWARLLSSSMRNDMRYTPSDCFETFPFPAEASLGPESEVERIGRELYEARANILIQREQGLTTTYNELKDSDNQDPEIVELRALHLAMDRAILAAYSWQDVSVPAFTTPVTDAELHEKEEFEDDVIDRLFALNAERAAEERVLGLAVNNAKKKAKKPRKKRVASTQQSLIPEPSPEVKA